MLSKYHYIKYRRQYYLTKKLRLELKNDKFVDIVNPFIVLFE